MSNTPSIFSAAPGWRRFGALLLAVAAAGLPVNELHTYALLLALAVVMLTGEISARPRAWAAAVAVVLAVTVAQTWFAPPRMDEGHNLFLPNSEVMQRELPPDVYRHMAQTFDAAYPPEKRCQKGTPGCWLNYRGPSSLYAFSADGIWHDHNASRSVTALDFSDPVWLRLGFLNEKDYNWIGDSDVRRDRRDRRFWMGLARWQIAMPWFEMVRLPPAMVGGELCWRGEVMWESAAERFVLMRGDGCRDVTREDAGRRVFGVAIGPDPLEMHLRPPWRTQLWQFVPFVLSLVAAFGLLAALVRPNMARAKFAFVLIGLGLIVIAVTDASFIGGVRPFDGGDDGLFYDGLARILLQKLLAGDIAGFLEGGEKVFYYGGPGLRYVRALEHIVFGETYFGYLSLVLTLPFLVLMLFRRFLPGVWAVALTLLFMAIPLGTVFGTSFVQFEQWAGRGFADSAAYILFIAGMLPIVGTAMSGPRATFAPAFFGALLLAFGIFMKPVIAPAAAVLMGGAGLAALWQRQWTRLAGLCIGFVFVFSMLLHNWVFGRALVLFSSNAQDSNLLVMPPSAWLAAACELVTLNFTGGNLARVPVQLLDWLSGPSGSWFAAPLSAAGVAIVVYVVVRGRDFDPWLRLIGAAALAQHVVALFYNAATPRYHYLTWFLTMVVTMVWLRHVALNWICRRYPDICGRVAAYPLSQRLASGLARLQAFA